MIPNPDLHLATGSCEVPLPAVSRLRVTDSDDKILDDVDHHQHFSMPTGRAYSVGGRPPGGSHHGGSNSSVSTTESGSGLPKHRSAFIAIPGASNSEAGSASHGSSVSPGAALTTPGNNAHTTGQSPSTMASRIGSWFRHRAGSVPAKSAIARRRHRTQSEGEKDETGAE